MKHRERVETALGHQAPDRCPLQISFTPEFAARLSASLGDAASTHHNPHGGGNPYVLERALDEDMLLTSVGWANSYYASTAYSAENGTYTDEWGIVWRDSPYTTRFGEGMYTEMVGHPLEDDASIASYRGPDPGRPILYAESQRTIDAFKDEYWIVGVAVTTIFETAWALRGYERMLMDFMEDPDRAEAILDIPFRYHLRVAEELTRMGVDMIWTGDDVGMQQGMLIAPETWRRFLKPRMALLFARIKAINPSVKIAYHSDGCISPIIPDLMEIGLDVLNPVQPRSMDPAQLKREFGKKLCFWGTIDEQYTLPFGTAQEVKREVIDRLSTIGRGGGLIIGPTHHVQLDTPLENVQALVDAVRDTPCQQ
jgi:uroporphyrinogen decarboxylase